MKIPTNLSDRSLVSKQPSDDHSVSCEQHETWFLGSLMRVKKPQRDFRRLSSLHNQITHEETNFDERIQVNWRVASQLSEFFPLKWLVEITTQFRKLDSTKLGIKTFQDRVCSYLGYIELYLTFRGLTLLDSTLVEINNFLDINISKNDVRTWKSKLLRITPGLQEQWIKIRAKTHQTAIMSTVVQVMNRELVLANCTKEEVFKVKQSALLLARKFVETKNARHVKKPEVWAYAICTKALLETLLCYESVAFPHLSLKTRKVIENKRWQLDKLIG
ncbi:MAG: hypothetical protein ACFFDT_15720 [Candidatus Hodarchaeota archaeon]